MKNLYIISSFCKAAFLLFFLFAVACKAVNFTSPAGYDLSAPIKHPLKNSLKEISGICFADNSETIMYAIQDEQGKIYLIDVAADKSKAYSFGQNGDYEDLARYGSLLYVLRSDGLITVLQIANGEATSFAVLKTFENLLPKGEYEGMCVVNDSLYVLCKASSAVKAKQELGIYRFQIDSTGNLSESTVISPGISIAKDETDTRKQRILPSCLAKNPVDKRWYVVSGANRLMLVLNEQFTLLNSYALDPQMFAQPEGITFNKNGDMFISNEENNSAANILEFRYAAP